MCEALRLAAEAARDGEVPVGAVVTIGNKIIGRGRNCREKERNALCHAEIQAINEACTRLGGWRLWECEMYVTLEPCPMCAGTIVMSGVDAVYYGAPDEKAGCAGSRLYPHSPGQGSVPESGPLQTCAAWRAVHPDHHGFRYGAGTFGRLFRSGNGIQHSGRWPAGL